MTKEDLQQIAALIAASELRVIERMTSEIATLRAEIASVRAEIAAVEQRLTEHIDAVKADLTERQDRAVELIAREISNVRSEFSTKMEDLAERLKNFGLTLFSIDQRSAGHTRAVDSLLAAQLRRRIN